MDSGVSACSPGTAAVEEEAPPCSPTHSTFSDAAKDTARPLHHPFSTSSAKEAAAAGLGQNPPPPPPYTSGPSRVILANDGTKDCLALLLTPDLVAALKQISKYRLALDKKDGAIERLEADIKDGVGKMEKLTLALEDERYDDRKEEMELELEILQLEREEAEERKGELVDEVEGLERGLRFERLRSESSFEEAMVEADLLLEPDGLGSGPDGDNDDDDDNDDESSVADSIDAPSLYSGVAPSPEEQRLRDAQMEVVASYDVLKTCRARLDDTRLVGYNDEKKLAGTGFGNRSSSSDDDDEAAAAAEKGEEGDECGRTEFDHRHLRHAQSLTREVGVAERGFKNAKGRLRELELELELAPVAEEVEECAVPRNVDQKRIEDWRRGVDGEAEGLEDGALLDLDDWKARPVEIMDSISAVDREEYVEEIEEWKGQCRRLREEVIAV